MNKLLLLTTFIIVSAVPSHRNWKLIDNKYYQLDSGAVIPLPQDLSAGVCLPDMVRVQGLMKQDPSFNQSIEELQKTTCTKWINRNFPERCIEFDRQKWLTIVSKLTTKPMNFCIDQYEYPNQKGQNPVIFVNFNEAKQLCQAQNKRLCTETEWTFACEGEDAFPYPYGYVRDTTACVIDKPWRVYHAEALQPRIHAAAELDRLWQGEPSGARPNCKSPFGVYDMTGNVDEITAADRPSPHKLVLKGGYWGPVRTRCRPSTRNHDENFLFYQEGLRCCKSI